MPLIRSKSSLSQVAKTLTLRCDAKQVEPRFLQLDSTLAAGPIVRLNRFMPEPFVKGRQPVYVEDPQGDFAYVVSTLAVRPLRISATDCRYTTIDFFKSVGDGRQLKDGDIVLTMDGGTSIGKVAVFDRAEFAKQLDVEPEDVQATVDSHVAIIRPEGISPLALAFLLASPIGQLQFQRAESGASGQTAVTEDDVRYFKFPEFTSEELESSVIALRVALEMSDSQIEAAQQKKKDAWHCFENSLR